MFILRHDHQAHFRFAPIDSDTMRQRYSAEQRTSFPDSIIVGLDDGPRVEFAAVKAILHHLGGGWAVLAKLAAVVPLSIGDALYRLVAKNRKRFFARPSSACPVVPVALRDRFLP